MIPEIKARVSPKWLMEDRPSFDINNILEDSLYYPCCWFDGDPIKYFAGNVHSFIYVDYGVTKQSLAKEVARGLRGYKIRHQEVISQSQLTPNGWELMVNVDPEDLRSLEFHRSFMKTPFSHWVIYERDLDFTESHGPERISFLFICADGALTYQALYLQNEVVPAILAVIQPGHGFGGNYTNYYDNQRIFYKSVIYRDEPDFYPEYFVTNVTYHKWQKHRNLIKKMPKFVNNHGEKDRYTYSNYDGTLYLWEVDKEIQNAKTKS